MNGVMQNMRRLISCAVCSARMAAPGTQLCTMCDATLYAMVPHAPTEGD